MAKLLVFAHGQQITHLELVSGQEYYAGRADGCAIALGEERGISRQHLKFFELNGIWQVECVSKFGGLNSNGSTLQHLALDKSQRFSVPPYEFEFELAPAVQPEMPAIPKDADIHKENSFTAELNLESPDSVSKKDVTGNFESTQAGGVITLVPHLKITNKKTGTEEVLKLEGGVWTVGRNEDCEIPIKDANMSRKHFEITRTHNGYNIMDLGSSNGTQLNEEVLTPKQAHPLKSGDVIRIKQISVIFEVRDVTFDKRVSEMANLPALIASPSAQHEDPAQNWMVPGRGVEKVQIEEGNLSLLKNPMFRKAAIGIAAVTIIYGLFFSNDNSENLASKEPAKAGSSDKVISPEQEQQAKSHFELAVSHLRNQKYQLCISQIELVHKIMPLFQNSQEIERQCQQALELEQITRDNERKAREKEEVENKINVTVENCKSQMTVTTTSEEIKKCLEPALELSPEHPAISDLLTQIQIRESEEQAKEQSALASSNRRASGRALFSQAQKLETNGDIKTALSLYKKFLGGNYGLGGEAASARIAIEKIERQMQLRLDQATKDCESLVGQEKYKDAVSSCDIVLKENPNYAPARKLRNEAFARLRKIMKTIWEEAILAESYGNIEAAKEKWKSIKDQSIPEDAYYMKSRIKLKKHGADF